MTTAWSLSPGEGWSSLVRTDAPLTEPGFGEVRVTLMATSINARDLMVAEGRSPMPAAPVLTPLSDGAGIVDAVGEGVDGLVVGDRVVCAFNPAHQAGEYFPWMERYALGGVAQGLLRETVVLDERALVPLPDEISYEQAACLPCAGVVAWNALFETGAFYPGNTVLATGTGSVSLLAVLLAKAAGAHVGITSSSEEKIERAAALGADFGVNYRADAEWDKAVRSATAGVGAHIVLENAGPPSAAISVRAAAQGGRVVQIGWKGLEGPPISVIDLALGGVSLVPAMVGSRLMLERLVAAVSANRISIPIHEVVQFGRAPDAFRVFAEGSAFGKVVISHQEH